jgi:hypothetical protein
MIRILSTVLPFDGGSPDYSGVPSYALSALQEAFDRGDYEIIPDPDPVDPAPVEDWPSFNTYMLTSPLFRARRDIVRPIDPELNSALYDAYALVERNGVEAFALIWAYWCQLSGIPPEEKEVLGQVAESLNLPADFVALLRGPPLP